MRREAFYDKAVESFAIGEGKEIVMFLEREKVQGEIKNIYILIILNINKLCFDNLLFPYFVKKNNRFSLGVTQNLGLIIVIRCAKTFHDVFISVCIRERNV